MVQRDGTTAPPPLLEVRDLRKTFTSKGIFSSGPTVVAASEVSFQLVKTKAVALVGESGSGKSTIAKMLMRLETPDKGAILLDGEDVLTREPRGASLAYRRRVQMIFQDPFGSLNPVHDVAHHLIRPLLRHKRASRSEARQRAVELLESVDLEPARDFIDRHPFELSGGQRQRVAIARALAVEPDLLVADEPTSMLDVSIRLGVLNLLAGLKERGLAILLITHDLASARYLADRILVLFRGRVVEDGPSEVIVRSPAHPYTKALLSSIANIGDDSVTPKTDSSTAAQGCPFASRCADVFDACTVDPAPREYEGRAVRCHLYPETVG